MTLDQIVSNRAKLSTKERLIYLRKLEGALSRKLLYLQKKAVFKNCNKVVALYYDEKDQTYNFSRTGPYVRMINMSSNYKAGKP